MGIYRTHLYLIDYLLMRKKHYQHLCYNHPQKHAQRIDGGVTDGSGIAFHSVIGIAQSHRISH